METRDAIALIRSAVGDSTGVWADLGAGSGTFTRALTEILGRGSTVYAVDRDASAVAALGAVEASEGVKVIPVQGDFTQPLSLPGLGDALLDGILLANALHFAEDAGAVLATLVRRLRVGGALVVVEYDRRAASRWVPYPIGMSRWPELAAEVGLSRPTITDSRPSEYGGILYVASARRVV